MNSWPKNKQKKCKSTIDKKHKNWIAVDRYGKKFINFVIGDRSNKTTSKQLCKEIEHHKMNDQAIREKEVSPLKTKFRI